uniref:Reverse transcriptase zinc-binding domain-containing protein n=1 Tax=Fagus sylvatica TaxID=28930 RepID=A0A2N9GYZ1_FAGSY
MIQAIPTYAMSCFKFPAVLCADLSAMATRFWWGQCGDERKIHWLSKQKLMRPKHEGGIGFRDLQLFNRALLARQGWRLLQNPSSLVFRVLKAKYFPCTSFLEASIPGEKIKIWKDRWLPNPTTFKVVSPIQILDADAMAIPLSHCKPNDVLIWTSTKNGVFSVRSAYKMLLSNTFAAEASSSSPTNHENQLWPAIWSASIQPKVRVFIWKARKGILSTRTNLFDKGLSNSFSCVWCEDEAETGDHLLWGCEFAQRVWKDCPVNFPAHLHASMSFKKVILCCVSDLISPGLEIVLTTAWAIWKARNDIIWNNHITPIFELCQQAASTALEYIESGLVLKETIPAPTGRPVHKWTPLVDSHYKLNFSCKFGVDGATVGIGVIIRDSLGLVAAVKCFQLTSGGDMLQVHARAVLADVFSLSGIDWSPH